MDLSWQDHLDRWHAAGLVDASTTARIREFEAAQPDTRRARWPVILAVVFGGVLLASGLFLFVQAHWDELAPAARIAILLAALGALHTGAAFSARFPAMATTLHAVGTAALGGAIALAGQVFHMEEHWPTAMLLWALGAWAGFLLLRDVPQLLMAAVLTPAWVASEFIDQSRAGHDPTQWTAAFVAVLCLVYLGASRPTESVLWRHALAAIGAVGLIPATILAAVARTPWEGGWWMLLLPLPLAAVLRRRAGWPALGWAGWAVAQVLASIHRMPVTAHLLAGGASVALAAWGIAELRKERVNLGLAGFVLTVVFFYFSYVADAVNRSLGLIVLGLLFLAGGWQLERLRRRLMRRIEERRA